MNKLDSEQPSLKLSIASPVDSHPDNRLIVLVPDSEVDLLVAARRVWELAGAIGGRVRFLGLCNDVTREPALRRSLVTLSAMVQDGRMTIESGIEFGVDWLEVVKSNWRVGDVIACFEEKHVEWMHRPLNQILESNLNASVYVLSGLSDHDHPRPDWLSQILVWIGSVGIVAGSGLLQIRIASILRDGVQTTLLILSVVAEVWLIWVWNSLFG